MGEIAATFRLATEEFGKRVQTIADGQWNDPTPCTEWNVHALVNHLVNEALWVPPLLDGKTVEQVGDRFDGDLLGDDPKGAWERAARNAQVAASEEGIDDRTVHVSFGDISASVYLGQVAADHVIHAWDLARATGADDRLDPDLVDFAYTFLKPQAEGWRAAGVFGEEITAPEGASRQTELLAMCGRKA